MSWEENVNVPISYENGIYKVVAVPYRRMKTLSRPECKEKIVQYLSIHPGTTQTTMGRKLGIRWHTINPILSELVDEGVIRKEFSESKLKGEGSKYYLIKNI